MDIYLVGGAVRDELLGLPVKERDWVVVGATPEELIADGFQPVGKEFPVFLHPETHEEYALARTERKVGKGYKGFTFYAAPDVNLIDDLRRRDLTINAMARSQSGELIDPFHGKSDLEKQVFRHVSSAFAEDPVRILRVARFACKLPEFEVVPETNQLMEQMVIKGEVNALVPERVWQEFARALKEKSPERFFDILNQCGALKILFPEINPHGNGIKALIEAKKITQDAPTRFAVLLHDVTESSVKSFCKRLRAPREFSDIAHLVSQWFETYHSIYETTPSTLLHFIKSVDALRRPNRFEKFLTACQASMIIYDNGIEFSRQAFLIEVVKAILTIDITPLQKKGLRGHEFAAELHKLQIKTIKKAINKIQHLKKSH